MMRAICLAMFMVSRLAPAQVLTVETLPPLAQARSNNAVAAVTTDRGVYLYSFLGLGSGKTWRDISAAASVLGPGAGHWRELGPVPGDRGRLAASAVAAGGAAWLFGGYTVDLEGGEVSTAGVYRIRPGEAGVRRVTAMPVAVDDTVALVYRDRYVYLFSGWHDLGNVNLVQVFDTQTLEWTQATPWPGTPVFGHAGGGSDGRLLVCDGVGIQYPATGGKREFLPSGECWLGEIDRDDYRRIHWRPAPSHPGKPRYRMAAAADDHGRVVFAGGSINPYNYDGIGYNGVEANAEKTVISFDLDDGRWRVEGDLPTATMDHRGLPFAGGWFYVIGGMREGQTPAAGVFRFRLDTSRRASASGDADQ